MKALLTLVGLAVSLALVAGCGGDDEPTAPSAEAWAEDFCTTVTDWTDELEAIGETLNDPSALSVDALRAAAQDVNAATEQFVDDVRSLGAPDTESGEEIESSLEALADTVESQQGELEEALDDLSGLTDVPAAITAVGTALTAMGAGIENAFEALEEADVRGELETALEESEACDQITG